MTIERKAMKVLPMVPREERVIGSCYQSETEFGIWNGLQIRKLCRDCLTNGRVPRTPMYNDENGSKYVLCAPCAKEKGTYSFTKPCIDCNKTEASQPAEDGSGKRLCAPCARKRGTGKFANVQAFLKDTHKFLIYRHKNFGGTMITYEQMLSIYHTQGGKCAITGRILNIQDKQDQPSPDRIDCAKGYIPGNVRLTTWRYNRCRSNESTETHLEYCRDVVREHEASGASSERPTLDPPEGPTTQFPEGPTAQTPEGPSASTAPTARTTLEAIPELTLPPAMQDDSNEERPTKVARTSAPALPAFPPFPPLPQEDERPRRVRRAGEPSPFEKLKQLKELVDAGVITADQFEKKREELLELI